jgi:hypothetical protein
VQVLLFREEKEEEVVGVVVGMEYLVSLADVGLQVFCFSGLGVGGDGIFCVPSGCGDGTLADVGIEEEEEEEEEEGNHLRKEPVPYYVNYKEYIS